MSAPKVDVLAVMKLVRAYGRACTRDGARCVGFTQPGHGHDVLGARIKVEKALEALVTQCQTRAALVHPLSADELQPEWEKFVASGKRPNYFHVAANEKICFFMGYNAALARIGGAA